MPSTPTHTTIVAQPPGKVPPPVTPIQLGPLHGPFELLLSVDRPQVELLRAPLERPQRQPQQDRSEADSAKTSPRSNYDPDSPDRKHDVTTERKATETNRRESNTTESDAIRSHSEDQNVPDEETDSADDVVVQSLAGAAGASVLATDMNLESTIPEVALVSDEDLAATEIVGKELVSLPPTEVGSVANAIAPDLSLAAARVEAPIVEDEGEADPTLLAPVAAQETKPNSVGLPSPIDGEGGNAVSLTESSNSAESESAEPGFDESDPDPAAKEADGNSAPKVRRAETLLDAPPQLGAATESTKPVDSKLALQAVGDPREGRPAPVAVPVVGPPQAEFPRTRLPAETLSLPAASDRQGGLLPADSTRLLQRVARAFAAAAERGGEVTLRLSPPELGSVRLEVQVQDGVLVARLETETADARAAILENLPALRERLADQGVRVERFDVDLMNRQPGGTPNRSFDNQREAPRVWQPPAQTQRPEEEAAQHRNSRPVTTGPGRLNVVV